MDWMGKEVAVAPDGLPEPLRWRPVFLWRALCLGFLVDLGGQVLLQQLGREILTARDFLEPVLVGAALGVVAPSFGRLAGVLWANRAIRRARREVPPP